MDIIGIKLKDSKIKILVDKNNTKSWRDMSFTDIDAVEKIISNLKQLQPKMQKSPYVIPYNEGYRKNAYTDKEGEQIVTAEVKLFIREEDGAGSYNAVSEDPFYIPQERTGKSKAGKNILSGLYNQAKKNVKKKSANDAGVKEEYDLKTNQQYVNDDKDITVINITKQNVLSQSSKDASVSSLKSSEKSVPRHYYSTKFLKSILGYNLNTIRRLIERGYCIKKKVTKGRFYSNVPGFYGAIKQRENLNLKNVQVLKEIRIPKVKKKSVAQKARKEENVTNKKQTKKVEKKELPKKVQEKKPADLPGSLGKLINLNTVDMDNLPSDILPDWVKKYKRR